MAQFDVHANRDPETRDRTPFLIDLQADLLGITERRVVAPLVRAQIFSLPARRLNPVFEIEGRSVVMSTLELGTIRRAELGPVVTSLAAERDRIVAAVDVLLLGV